jgi:CRISPR-associated protein Csx17
MPSLGLVSRHPAPLADVQAWIVGGLDDRRIAALARPLMAVRWWEVDPKRGRAREPSVPLAPFGLFRSLFPSGNALEIAPRPESGVLRLLVGGRLEDASRRAARRLVALGLRPKLERVVGSPELARRMAAAILIPLSPHDQRRLLQRAVRESSPATDDSGDNVAYTDA